MNNPTLNHSFWDSTLWICPLNMHPRPGHVLTSVLLGPEGWPTQCFWILFELTRSPGQNKTPSKGDFWRNQELQVGSPQSQLSRYSGVPSKTTPKAGHPLLQEHYC